MAYLGSHHPIQERAGQPMHYKPVQSQPINRLTPRNTGLYHQKKLEISPRFRRDDKGRGRHPSRRSDSGIRSTVGIDRGRTVVHRKGGDGLDERRARDVG